MISSYLRGKRSFCTGFLFDAVLNWTIAHSWRICATPLNFKIQTKLCLTHFKPIKRMILSQILDIYAINSYQQWITALALNIPWLTSGGAEVPAMSEFVNLSSFATATPSLVDVPTFMKSLLLAFARSGELLELPLQFTFGGFMFVVVTFPLGLPSLSAKLVVLLLSVGRLEAPWSSAVSESCIREWTPSIGSRKVVQNLNTLFNWSLVEQISSQEYLIILNTSSWTSGSVYSYSMFGMMACLLPAAMLRSTSSSFCRFSLISFISATKAVHR